MAEVHLSSEQLEQYVLGALSPAEAAALEAHAAACDACTLRLAEEARLELALTEVARAPIPLTVARRRRGLMPAVVLGALAAGALLWLAPDAPSPTPAPPPAVLATAGARVVCLQSAGRSGCVADAQQHGLLLQDPARPQDVPLYEEGTQVPREALTAQHPFSL